MDKLEILLDMIEHPDRYTEEQMRILLCMRDMVKEEVKKEVARQIKMINKQ